MSNAVSQGEMILRWIFQLWHRRRTFLEMGVIKRDIMQFVHF